MQATSAAQDNVLKGKRLDWLSTKCLKTERNTVRSCEIMKVGAEQRMASTSEVVAVSAQP